MPRSRSLSQAITEGTSRGVLLEDFLQTEFSFAAGTRLLVDSSALIGALNANDEWHAVLSWLFQKAILTPEVAPRTFITPHILGEYAHYATKGLLKSGNEALISARNIAMSQLDRVIGLYPMIELLPDVGDVIEEWRLLYTSVPFGTTDAFLLATCKVKSLDFLTVDNRLVDVARQNGAWLKRQGYRFTIYSTANPASTVPPIQ